MHELQKMLLYRLWRQNKQKYGTLTRGYDFDDNVVFHLGQLIGAGLITKNEGIYTITTSGAKEIAKYDLDLLTDTGVKTFFIGFLCQSGDEYLLKNHPSAGKNDFYNLPSGKPRFGEKIEKALVRAFQQYTGLGLKPEGFKYLGLHLKTVQTSAKETLFDDAFAIYEVVVPIAQKEKMRLKPGVNWYSPDRIKRLSNCWPEIDICILKKDPPPYLSYSFTSDYVLG